MHKHGMDLRVLKVFVRESQTITNVFVRFVHSTFRFQAPTIVLRRIVWGKAKKKRQTIPRSYVQITHIYSTSWQLPIQSGHHQMS